MSPWKPGGCPSTRLSNIHFPETRKMNRGSVVESSLAAGRFSALQYDGSPESQVGTPLFLLPLTTDNALVSFYSLAQASVFTKINSDTESGSEK